MTCSGGTGIAGDYLADNEADAIKAAEIAVGEDEWTYYVLETKETNTEKNYTYKITIDDSQCAYEYAIRCDGEVSIHEIAELVNKYLRSDQPLSAGKYIEQSGETIKNEK